MTSSRPYLIRALYEWILDNGGIPHLLVNTELPSVIVPKEFIENGKIILDLSPEAVRDLIINNENIEFRGRFSEAIKHVSLPIESVLAIYNENGVGMFFEDTEFETDAEDIAEDDIELNHYLESPTTSKKTKKKQKSYPSHLKIVK